MQCVIFAKQEPLCTLWLASHNDKRIKRNQVCKTDIAKCCKVILHSSSSNIAFQMRGQLMLGIVRLFFRKVRYYLSDINETLMKIKLATEDIAAEKEDDLAVGKQSTRDRNLDRIKIKFDITDNDPVIRHRAKKSHMHEITIPEEIVNPAMLNDIDNELQMGNDVFRNDPLMDEESMAMSNSLLKSILDEYLVTSPKQPNISAVQADDVVMQMTNEHPEIDISIQPPNPMELTSSQSLNIQKPNDTKINYHLEEIFHKSEKLTAKKNSKNVHIDTKLELDSSDLYDTDMDKHDSLKCLMLPPYNIEDLVNVQHQSKEHLFSLNGFLLCSNQIHKIIEDDAFVKILHEVYDLDNVKEETAYKRSISLSEDKHQAFLEDSSDQKRRRSTQCQSALEMMFDNQVTTEDRLSRHYAPNDQLSMNSQVLAAGGDFSIADGNSAILGNTFNTRELYNSHDIDSNSMLNTIAHTLINDNTTYFSVLYPKAGGGKRAAARTFALLLELRKSNAIKLHQNETYGEIEITTGNLFNSTFKSIVAERTY